MVKVFWKNYPVSKPNAICGGELFIGGISTFKDKEAGIHFANVLGLRYEVEEEIVPIKKPAKKKVNK